MGSRGAACFLVFTLWGGAVGLSSRAHAEEARPNIVLILADDLGFSDLGCFGGEIKTPNLDRLAAQGLRLTQLYNTARCCPTRASLLTGLYPHQAGVGAMSVDHGLPGYRGFLTSRCVTLAEVLGTAGYQSFLSGKWHLRGSGNAECIPTKRGFDEFYGHFRAYASFYRSDLYVRHPLERSALPIEPDEFYATDAITDYALQFLRQAREQEKPYFLYLAYNAPHFPLQAPREVIDRYVPVYEKGWDAIREERGRRLQSQGILGHPFQLPPRDRVPKVPERNRDSPYYGKNIPAWEEMPRERRQDLTRRMATYAAMVEIMDQNIGRLVEDLEGEGELDNTLLIFLSDNGACAEWDPYGFDDNPYPQNRLYAPGDLELMGQPGTFHSYGTGWANACNTPFRLYKHYNHEGGISAPFVLHWPDGVQRAGEIERQPAHVLDLAITLYEIAGADYPTEWKGESILPLEGVSLTPLLDGEALPDRALFFEHEGNRAVRRGKWKIVRTHGAEEWELYEIEKDRTERKNLAGEFPETVAEMSRLWDEWAIRCFVAPEKVAPPFRGMPKIYYAPVVP